MTTVSIHDTRAEHVTSMLAALRREGGRATLARRAVITALMDATDEHGHVTAEAVLAAGRRTYPELVESTVYRTLSALEDADVVRVVHVPFGPAVHHLRAAAHQHVQCHRCHLVFDVAGLDLGPLAKQIAERTGFRLQAQDSAFGGLCRDCQASPAFPL